jgi:hypothetical protein
MKDSPLFDSEELNQAPSTSPWKPIRCGCAGKVMWGLILGAAIGMAVCNEARAQCNTGYTHPYAQPNIPGCRVEVLVNNMPVQVYPTNPGPSYSPELNQWYVDPLQLQMVLDMNTDTE